jgi:hypothetical protein
LTNIIEKADYIAGFIFPGASKSIEISPAIFNNVGTFFGATTAIFR